MTENINNPTRGMPMLALVGLTAFPGMLLTFDIERPMSMAALNFAMGADQNIFLVTQKDVSKDILSSPTSMRSARSAACASSSDSPTEIPPE